MSIQYEGIGNSDVDDLLLAGDTHEVAVLLNAPSSRRGTTWYGAVFLVVNAALGAGLLDFPLAFSQAGGMVAALSVQTVLVAFAVGALVIVAHCSDADGSATYQDVVLGTCGNRAHMVCALIVALYCYGTCVTFVIIVGDQFDRALGSLYGSDFCHFWYMSRYFTTCVSFFVLVLPLCFSKKIDFLKYPSMFGVISILYVAFVVAFKYYEGKFVDPIATAPKSWMDIFLVAPVICFGYQCHISSVPIYSCMRERNLQSFVWTVLLSTAICVCTYSVAGIFGLLTFGDRVSSDILYAYDGSDPVVLVGIVALSVKTFTTYPILLFCGRQAVENLLKQVISDPRSEKTRRGVVVLLWFGTSVALALFIPNIGVVIQLLGSLAALFIFVFPGLCLLFVTLRGDPDISRTKSKASVAIAALFLTVGVFLFGLVLAQSVTRDLRGPGEGVLVLCT